MGFKYVRLGVLGCLIVAAVVVGDVISSPAAEPVQAQEAALSNETVPDFDDWHLGDVHTHGSGDSGLGGHKRCDTRWGPGGALSESECAELVLGQIYDKAEANGVEWMILVEHGTWLGFNKSTWNRGQAERQFEIIADEAQLLSRTRGTVRVLMGQELGSANPPCAQIRGHFSTYYAPRLLSNSIYDCNEVRYLRTIEDGLGWGAINHPDIGSKWACWYTDDDIIGPENCEEGFVDFAEGRDDIIGPPPHELVSTNIEVVTSNELPPNDTVSTWHRMLQDGYRIGATGGSDAHTVNKKADASIFDGGGDGNDAKVGIHARTYAFVDGDVSPSSQFSTDAFSDPIRVALRNGRSIASNGPLVLPQVDGVFPGGTLANVDRGFDGDSITVRIDWPAGESFTTLEDGADQANPDADNYLQFQHRPDSLRVIVGNVSGPGGCVQPSQQPCEDDLRVVERAPTADELASGTARIEIPVDNDWDSIFVRTESAQQEMHDTEPYEFGSFASPIYLQRRAAGGFDAATGCRTNTLAKNDDGSTPSVALPFTANFFGSNYNNLYVNNNGNVTFNSGLSTYTPFRITANTPPIIAPFLADVDTRGSASRAVTYGETTIDGRNAFCVYWDEVGYYSSRSDKLNTIRLYLVDRSDVGPGEFDIIFDYRKIVWETGDASGGSNGFGGTSAGAGFSSGNGAPNGFFELPGSLVNGALIDGGPNSLTASSRNSLDDGIWRFEIRQGTSGVETLTGTVRTLAESVPEAFVFACAANDGPCTLTMSDENGEFAITGLTEGPHTVQAFPPQNQSGLGSTFVSNLEIEDGRNAVDLVLPVVSSLRVGTTIEPLSRKTRSGATAIDVGQATTLATTACANATASVVILQGGSRIAGPITLAEAPTGSGNYTAGLPAFANSGTARIEVTAECANGPEVYSFNIYIDPSGVVVDQDGTPIPLAIATLYRSDTANGPFIAVEDGSAIMSPSNRTNPDTTDSAGQFRWDVIAGYYKVRAQAPGCRSMDDTQSYTETEILKIPPPALDLQLQLDCSEPTTGNLAIASILLDQDPGATGAISFDVACTLDGRTNNYGPITVPLGERSVVENLPVGTSCLVEVTDAPPELNLASPAVRELLVLPGGETPIEFVGVTTSIPGEFAVSLISSEVEPVDQATVEFEAICSNGDTRTFELAIDQTITLDGIPVATSCTVTATSAPGLILRESALETVVLPFDAGGLRFMAYPGEAPIGVANLRIQGTNLRADLTNIGDVALHVTSLEIQWPSASDSVKQVQLNNTMIFNGSITESPATIEPGAPYIIGAEDTIDLRIHFKKDAKAPLDQFYVRIDFADGTSKVVTPE